MKIENWIKTIVGVVLGLYVVASLITTLAPTNALFTEMIFGGGILAAILVAAKKMVRF